MELIQHTLIVTALSFIIIDHHHLSINSLRNLIFIPGSFCYNTNDKMSAPFRNSRIPMEFQRFHDSPREWDYFLFRMIILFLALFSQVERVNAFQSQTSVDNEVLSNQTVLHKFKNADQMILSKDNRYLFVLERFNRYNREPKLHVFNLEGSTVKLIQSLEVNDGLSMTMTKDSRYLFLLSTRGNTTVFQRSEDSQLIKKSTTLKEGVLFDQGKLMLSSNDKILYQSAGKFCYGRQMLNVYSFNPKTAQMELLQTFDSNNGDAILGASDMIVNNDHLYLSAFMKGAIMVFNIVDKGQLVYEEAILQDRTCPGVIPPPHYIEMDSSNEILASASQYISGKINFFRIEENGKLKALSSLKPKSYGSIDKMRFLGPNRGLLVLRGEKIELYTGDESLRFGLTGSLDLQVDNKRLDSRDLLFVNSKVFVLSTKYLVSLELSNIDRTSTPIANSKKPFIESLQIKNNAFVKTSEDSIRASEKLIEGIRTYEETKIVESIKSGVDVNRPDDYGGTPLMWAFHFGQANVIKFLVQEGASPEVEGVIYRDKSFETFYGDILSICLFKRHGELLKYSLDELKIPWNTQQFDPYSNKTSGHIALTEFLASRLRKKKQFNTEDIENCNYLIAHIKTSKEKKIYQAILEYIIDEEVNYPNHLIGELDNLSEPYLKLLQIELLLNKPHQRDTYINTLEKALELSQIHFGKFHPKTIELQVKISEYQLRNHEFQTEADKEKLRHFIAKSFRQRVTRYGLNHPLTLASTNQMRTISYKIDPGLAFEYSELSSDISSELESFGYQGVATPYSARQLQGMMSAKADFSDFGHNSRYFNNYNKSLAQRFRSFLSPNFKKSLYFPKTPKKYLDPAFLADYITENFKDLSKFSIADSTILINNMTNVYNTIYTYRRDAERLNIEESYIQELDSYLINMQLTIKGGNYNKALSSSSWEDISETLGEDEVAIEIVRFNETDFQKYLFVTKYEKVNYLCFVIEKGMSKPKVIPLKVNKTFEDQFAKLQNRGRFNQDLMNMVSSEDAFTKLWQELDKVIGTKKTVYLSADGMLHQFPLEALKLSTGEFLFDHHEIYRMINLNSISKIKGYESLRATMDNDAVIVGNPIFYKSIKGSQSTEKYTRELPETKKELDEIGGVLGLEWRVKRFDKNNATESGLKKLKSPQILHIATHGSFKGDSIKSPFSGFERSFLKLTGYDNLNSNQNRENDGALDGHEVLNMDLSKTELVVLSACETGVGTTINAEGVMNLSRAFLIAGAQSTISTLWKVNSELTKEFMISFYQELVKTGNRFKSFLKAKKFMKEKYEDPYFWAGYILTS